MENTPASFVKKIEFDCSSNHSDCRYSNQPFNEENHPKKQKLYYSTKHNQFFKLCSYQLDDYGKLHGYHYGLWHDYKLVEVSSIDLTNKCFCKVCKKKTNKMCFVCQSK